MKMLFLLVLLSSIADASNVFADACEARPWPYARSQTKEEFHQLMDTVKRDQLVRYLFQEVTKPESDSVGFYLGKYLMGTEQDYDMRGFFDLIIYSAEVSEKGVNRALDFKEVCEIYNKVLLEKGRKPSSMKSKKTAH